MTDLGFSKTFRRGSATWLDAGLVTWAAAAIFVAALVPASFVHAGKLPPPPAPVGTVLFDAQGEARGINANGTGSTLALIHGLSAPPVPSARVYGSDPVLGRYWLAVEPVAVTWAGEEYVANEIFAYRFNNSQLQKVQLTALFPYVNFSFVGGTRLHWSNDGDDSFVSALGRTFGADTQLTPNSDASDDLLEVFRLNINGSLLTSVFNGELAEPKLDLVDLLDGQWIESVLATRNVSNSNSLRSYHWSPNGNTIVYSMSSGLYVASIPAAQSYPVVHEDDSVLQIWNTVCNDVRWSPDGQRIAFGESYRIRTVKPDGSENTVVVGRTNSDFYSSPVWSPDGMHLALWHRHVKSLQFTYDLVRVPSTGGSITVLYKADLNREKEPTGWHLNLAPGQ